MVKEENIMMKINPIDKEVYDYWRDIIYLKNGESFCVDYDAWKDGDAWTLYYRNGEMVCQMRLEDVSAITTQRFKKIKIQNESPVGGVV
jgi:hypothetical protein